MIAAGRQEPRHIGDRMKDLAIHDADYVGPDIAFFPFHRASESQTNSRTSEVPALPGRMIVQLLHHPRGPDVAGGKASQSSWSSTTQ